MESRIETLAARLAKLYAGKGAIQMPMLWEPGKLFQEGAPANTFRNKHPEHAYAKFLNEFEKHYTQVARGPTANTRPDSFADLPFIGTKVLNGEPPVVVISQQSYSPRPGSVSLWAMLFAFGSTAPEEYATEHKWKKWASNYPKYQQVLCNSRSNEEFGLDPESLIVTDACMPNGCKKNEQEFLKEILKAFSQPEPKMILSLGRDTAIRFNIKDRWDHLRKLQKGSQEIDQQEAIEYLPTGVPVVISPFVWGNNPGDRGKPHHRAAVKATRKLLA